MRYSHVRDDEQKEILKQMIAQREEAHFRAGADADALESLAGEDERAKATVAALRRDQEVHEKVITSFRASLQRLNNPDGPKPNRKTRRAVK